MIREYERFFKVYQRLLGELEKIQKAVRGGDGMLAGQRLAALIGDAGAALNDGCIAAFVGRYCRKWAIAGIPHGFLYFPVGGAKIGEKYIAKAADAGIAYR